MPNTKLGKQTKVQIKQQKSAAPEKVPFTKLSPQGRVNRVFNNKNKMSESEIDRRIRKNTEIINRRFKTLQKHGYNNYTMKKAAELNALTRSKAKTKVGLTARQLSKMTRAQKANLLLKQEKLKHSKWSTLKGRREILKAEYESYVSRHKDDKNYVNISFSDWKEYGKMMDLLEDVELLSDLQSQAYVPSTMLVTLSHYYSADDVIKAMIKMSKSPENFKKIYNKKGKDGFIELITYIIEKSDKIDVEAYMEGVAKALDENDEVKSSKEAEKMARL